MLKHELKRMLCRKSFIIAVIWLISGIILSVNSELSSTGYKRSYTITGTPLFHLIKDKEYRYFERVYESEMNEAFYDGIISDFHYFVESNLQSEDKIKERLEFFEIDQTVEEAIKDIENATVVLNGDASSSQEFNVLYSYYRKHKAYQNKELLPSKDEILDIYLGMMRNPSQLVVEDYVNQTNKFYETKTYLGHSAGPALALQTANLLPLTYGVFLIILIVPYFSLEKKYKVESQSLSSKYGKKRLFYIRIGLIFSVILISYLFTHLLILTISHFIFSLHGLSNTVIPTIPISPYKYSYGGLYLRGFLSGLLASVTCSSILIYLSLRIAKPIPIISVSLTTMPISYLSLLAFNDINIWNNWYILNPINLFSPISFFYIYTPLVIGNHVFQPYQLAIPLCLFLCMIFFILSYRYYCRPRHVV